MVCVVNLVSPDGRYDATFLDNYVQINVVDALKRIPGVSDVNPSAASTPCDLARPRPDGQPAHSPSPRSSRRSSRRTSSPPPARSRSPAPPGQRFEYPITSKGRLSKVEEFEKIVVRRNDDGSFVYLSDVARVQLDSENYETAGWLNGKPAGTVDLPARRRQRPRHRRAGPRRDGPGGPELPRRPGSIGSPTTRPSTSARTSPRWGTRLIEAFLLVLIVVFVFLQGFRATAIPMIAILVSLVATFGMMAVFGLDQHPDAVRPGPGDRPGGRRRDHRRREHREVPRRGMQPLEATRAAMAEITRRS